MKIRFGTIMKEAGEEEKTNKKGKRAKILYNQEIDLVQYHYHNRS